MDEATEERPIVNRCPECSRSLDVTGLAPFSKIECPRCGASVRVRTAMGQYDILGPLGEGGMSMVFKARDRHLGREVALKVLHQSLSRDEALTAMFEREAKLTASILHPNVVKVYTVGNDQGYFFIAMELVDATSLEQLIGRKGALPESGVLPIAHDVVRGLAAAYQEGLIHRDIKPGNMLVTEDGTTKLVDFGLAVHQGGADESEDLWATPFYVPPEKLDGEPDTYLGDIYSLGATLYHALAGRPPFETNTSSLDVLRRAKRNEVDLKSAAPGVSKNTVRLIEKMMAYRPADRPQSYEAILEQVESVEKREFGTVRSPASDGGEQRRRARAAAGGALLLIVVIAVGVMLSGDNANEDGDLGIGSKERVINAGENTNAELFLRGRDLLLQGDYARARELFDGLTGETSLSASTRMWNHFFRGTATLLMGDEPGAREAFARIAEVPADEEEKGAAEVVAFLGEAPPRFSQPLPVLDAAETFPSDSVGALGLFVSGLKNWQHGQFESGMELLNAFADASPPEDFDWMEQFRAAVKRYRRDYERLAKLPNPSRANAGENPGFADQKRRLEKALPKLETPGALPELVRSRIARVEAIGDLIAEERRAKREAERLAAAQKKKENEEDASDAGEKMEEDEGGTPSGFTEEELAEKRRLMELFDSLAGHAETLSFSGALAELESISLETDRARQWRGDLVHAYEQAGGFVAMLASRLDGGNYEGAIRRREGVPIDATITSADPSIFVVDLGFGPNEVEAEAFAPDWMVEAAATVLPAPTPDTLAEWEKTVFFALATGQRETARRLAANVASVSPEFGTRWERLETLLSPAPSDP